MSDEQSMLRWELDALRTEYTQHWSHFRHAIDKSYQAFNIHMVMMALLFSAVSLANDQGSDSVSVPLFLVIGTVAFASSIGTISTLVTQRTGYVWHQKIIDVLRERISEKTNDTLKPEVSLFYDRRIFNPGTAWFGRVNFVVLTGSSVVILCAYLVFTNPLLVNLGLVLDGPTSLILALAGFVLSIQMMYHSVISHSLDRARKLFCQLQKYRNPPAEIREVKYLRTYIQYLIATEIIFLCCILPLISLSILFLGPTLVGIALLLLTARCWMIINRAIVC